MNKLNNVDDDDDTVNLLNETVNFNDKPYQLENIYSYFKNDLFQGFVLSLNHQSSSIIETYFKLNHNFVLQTINEPHEWHSNRKCSSMLIKDNRRQYFLNQIESIELSTDFDYREMRLNNYANLINENDRPVLVINFVHEYKHDLVFYIQWLNPYGKLMDESFWNLKAGVYNHGQFVYMYLNENVKLPIDVGTWSLRISLTSYFDRHRTRNLFLMLGKTNDVLINLNFNVMPSKITNESLFVLKDLFKFWSFDSICVNEQTRSNLFDYKLCKKDADWSSFYSDLNFNSWNI